MFVPYTLTGGFERGILVRTQGDPEALLNSVRREIWAVDRNVALTLTGSLTGYLRQFSYAGPRFFLLLLGVFASVGLVLVAIGVYSVIAYTVSRQTHEIGIRMALGASHSSVLRMVALMGLKLVAIGGVHRLAGELRGYKSPCRAALERLALRSSDPGQRRRGDGGRRPGGLLLSRPTGDAAGSDGRVEGGVGSAHRRTPPPRVGVTGSRPTAGEPRICRRWARCSRRL